MVFATGLAGADAWHVFGRGPRPTGQSYDTPGSFLGKRAQSIAASSSRRAIAAASAAGAGSLAVSTDAAAPA